MTNNNNAIISVNANDGEIQLRAADLACERDDRLLFKNIDICLKAGEILHVKGENGSGKTSLLSLLAGLLPPNRGSITWCGQDIAKQDQRFAYQQALCFIGHQTGIHLNLTPVENLSTSVNANQSHRIEEITQTLGKLGLAPLATTPCRHLSMGQRRRVALARLWLTSAPLWILDEPFSSLDTDCQAQLSEKFQNHLSQQGILVITSHQEINLPAQQYQVLQLEAGAAYA